MIEGRKLFNITEMAVVMESLKPWQRVHIYTNDVRDEFPLKSFWF